jgi:CheY-like chemotaxis protein
MIADNANNDVHLPERSARILAACRTPRTFGELVRLTGLPKATLHRQIAKLKGMGLLECRGEHYASSEGAPAALAGETPVPETADPILSVWPVLRLIPEGVFRAIVALVLFASIVRRNNLTDDRHVSFLFLGPTMKLKSFLCKALAYILGSSPTKCRIAMMQERGRSMIARVNAKGETIYEREALSEPAYWIEEASTADPNTKRDLLSIIHGIKSIPVGNKHIVIEGVPLIEMNARKPGTLEDQTGLEPQRLRRCITADFANINVTRKMRAHSQELLEKIKNAPKPDLSSAPAGPLTEETQSLVEEALAACIRPESNDLVDGSRILALILGARGVLPEREAAQYVLRCYMTVATTTYYTVENWQSRLAGLFRSGMERPEQPAQSRNSTETPTQAPLSPASPNTYDRDQVLLKVRQLIGEAGFHLWEDDDDILSSLRFARHLRENNVTPEDFKRVAEGSADLLDLQDEIASLGSTEERIRSLHTLGLDLDKKGIALEQVRRFLALHQELERLGFDGATAQALARALARLQSRSKDIDRITRRLLDLAARDVDLREEVARLRQQEQQLNDTIALLRKAQTDVCNEVLSLKAERQCLKAEIRVLHGASSPGIHGK